MENSTVKYKKFTISEKRSQKSSKTPLVVCILLVVCVALLTAAVIAIGVGVGNSVPGMATESLEVFTLTEGELQGQYYGANGGIYFQSTVNSSHIYFSVTTTDGKVIVLFVHPVDTQMTMVDVNETDFLMMKNQDGPEKYTEYLIPENSMDVMSSIMTGQRNMSDDVLEQLDTKDVSETRESSLRALAMSPEGSLIIEAAMAIGNLGIQGADSSAVMKFYQFAMKLSSAREQDITETSFPEMKDNRYKRRKRATQCPSNRGGDVCDTCPTGSNCLGMCGKGCTCWSFVCGDCCVHNYCLTHDQCCADQGFFTFSCFAVVFDAASSSCTDSYDC